MRGLWVGGVAVLLSASTALAGGFSIREQSAEGQGASALPQAPTGSRPCIGTPPHCHSIPAMD
jgi:hypothetical protein